MGKFEAYYDDAERLAVKEGKTQREIAEFLGISEKTISLWSKKGDWVRKRGEYLVSTRTGPVEKLKARFAKLLEDTDNLDAKKTDEIYKIQLLIDRMEGGSNIKGATLDVMDRFSTFIRQREPDQEFIEQLKRHTHAFFEEIKNL
ncbi:MAG: hypothetical protein AMXMBFR75_33320 [Candidatus Hinthialibacteria bacterium]